MVGGWCLHGGALSHSHSACIVPVHHNENEKIYSVYRKYSRRIHTRQKKQVVKERDKTKNYILLKI